MRIQNIIIIFNAFSLKGNKALLGYYCATNARRKLQYKLGKMWVKEHLPSLNELRYQGLDELHPGLLR